MSRLAELRAIVEAAKDAYADACRELGRAVKAADVAARLYDAAVDRYERDRRRDGDEA